MINAGQYTLTGALVMKAGVTLSGVGATTVLRNGEIDIYSSNVVVKSLRMEGTCHLTITTMTRDVSNVIVQDVSASIGAVESAFAVMTKNYKISNVQFIRDVVTNSGANGFLLSGNALISGVTFDSCKVTGSGVSTRYNDWISGFVLAQNAPVSNIKAINCESSNNWENGFFLKPSVSKTGVVLQDCVANNNGQKTSFKEGYGYLLDATVSMVNCQGTGNKGGLTNLATPPPPPAPAGSSKITLTLTSSSVETGKSISANGVLMGTTGIAGATVTLKVTLPDGTTAAPTQGTTVTTDSAGKFTMSYVPTKVGTYSFTATFAGNSGYTGSSASATFSAVAPPTPPAPTPTAYDYIVSSSVVKTASGATAYTGSSFTAALQWAVTQANKVTYVPAGTYTVTGKLSMASGSTLMGAGDEATGTVFRFTSNSLEGSLIDVYNKKDVTLKQFRFTDHGGIRLVADRTTAGGHLIQDVTAYYTSNLHEAAFQSIVLTGGTTAATMDGLTFIRCNAIYTGCMGFQLHGDGWLVPGGAWAMDTFPIWTKNVYMEECVADHCGVNSRYNDWVVGIDLAELTNVENVKVVRCVANYNWESGFHLEPMPKAINVVFIDCVANYNGQKPSTYYNQETNNYGPHFGAGYFLGRNVDKNQYTLTNSGGTGNAKGLYLAYLGTIY